MKFAVALYMGAWIEIFFASHFFDLFSESHSIWVRGLKYLGFIIRHCSEVVALYMGAWIEMFSVTRCSTWLNCRTLYGCVDWNLGRLSQKNGEASRTLYVCVDWNSKRITEWKHKRRRTLYRARIKKSTTKNVYVRNCALRNDLVLT